MMKYKTSNITNQYLFLFWLSITSFHMKQFKGAKYNINFTLLNLMNYKNVQIQYDKNGDVTEKHGKDLVSILILPNVQTLELCQKHPSKKSIENVYRIES